MANEETRIVHVRIKLNNRPARYIFYDTLHKTHVTFVKHRETAVTLQKAFDKLGVFMFDHADGRTSEHKESMSKVREIVEAHFNRFDDEYTDDEIDEAIKEHANGL